MTAALYRTLRKICGLTQHEAADFHQVKLRTIQHWESGRSNPPPGAMAELERLNAKIERDVAYNVHHHLEDGHENVTFREHRTAEGYAASRAGKEGMPWGANSELIGRTLLALRSHGVKVNVEYFD